MSKPVFTLQDADQIEVEIRDIVGPDKLDQLRAQHADYLQDFCSLGVLMTDAERCYEALKVLNSLLLLKLNKTTIPVKKSLFGSPRLQTVNDGEVKHFGLLSNFFKAWEGTCGFNAAQNLPMVPGNPMVPANTVPTVAHVIDSQKFRSHLFAPGYHWKDPGVGERHGEFTHRIQWYIVTQENVWTPFLNRTPLEIFKMFAHDLCVDDNRDKTIWDVVFDRQLTKTDFRTPETMHAWFKEPGQQKDKNIGILAQLIAGRSLKRAHQNFDRNKPIEKQAAHQIDIKANDAENEIFWYKTMDMHPKSIANPKVTWEESELVLPER